MEKIIEMLIKQEEKKYTKEEWEILKDNKEYFEKICDKAFSIWFNDFFEEFPKYL